MFAMAARTMSPMNDTTPTWRDVLRRTVEERFGHDVTAIAFERLENEVEHIARDRGEAWADAYAAEIARSPLDAPVVQALVALTTNKESYFFRDGPAMASLREDILPRVIAAARPTRTLRIWSAGCSTGEEIYTLAFLVHELLGAEIESWRIAFVGTDIDARALAAASAAEYGPWSFRATSPDANERYFEPVPGTKRRRIRSRYRVGVSFELQNLAAANVTIPGPGEFDLVFCRNVTIYFTEAARENLASRLLAALSKDGSIICGPSDPLPTAARNVGILPGLIELRRVPAAAARRRTTPSAMLIDARAKDSAPIPKAPPLPRLLDVRPAERARPVAEDADDVQIAAARRCADRGDVEKAGALLSRVIGRGTVVHDAYLLRAILHESAGEHELAVDHYKRALYLEPRGVETHARLGLLQSRMGETAEAIRSLRNAIALGAHRERTESTERLTAAAANQLARLLMEKRDASR